jgi:hypothetical protein
VSDNDGKLKFLAVGNNAKGIVAFGVLAEGVIAVGVNAVGVVAIGVNAMGTLAAVGVNALGLFAFSVANSIALVALSVVNVIGGFGVGFVNSLVHPVLSIPVLVAMVVVSLRVKGAWHSPEIPPTVPLASLQQGAERAGWSRVKLFGLGDNDLVVGNSDDQQSLRAGLAVRQQAERLLGARPRKVLVRVEVTEEHGTAPHADYRVAAERALSLHAVEIRPWPRRPPWPQRADELRWLVSRSLWLWAAVGVALTVYLWVV